MGGRGGDARGPMPKRDLAAFALRQAHSLPGDQAQEEEQESRDGDAEQKPMTKEQETVLVVKGAISELPAAEQEACKELAEHIRRVCRSAGEPVSTLALALVGAEEQARMT